MKNENAEKQQENSKRVVGRPFPKGVSGNLAGRPKGKTIKERVREYLEKHPKDMDAFVAHFIKENRELAWQMLEGRPPQDLTSGGDKIEQVPIYAGQSIHSVQRHDSDEAGVPTQEED